MICQSYTIEGLKVRIRCDTEIYSTISGYLSSLCKGKNRLKKPPLEVAITVTDRPPKLPPNSVKTIKRPSIETYLNGNDIYFTSKDGSIIYLDPINRKSKIFFTQKILNKTVILFSLLGGTIVETLKYDGLHFLHAAALSNNELKLLISGDGGCGKTTTTLSLVRAGFKYLSDDSIFVEEQNGEIQVSPFYSHFHIDKNLSDRFPEFTAGNRISIPKGTKIGINASETFPGSFIPCLSPNVIIFPKITPAPKSFVRPIGKIEVFNRLLTQIVLAPDDEISKKQIELLRKLVNQTLGFELLCGKDVYDDPSSLLKVIKKIKRTNGNSTEI